MLKLKPINSGTVIPVDYSHIHDKTLVFTKYRENFDFGLSVNEYYFNQNPQDKKSNFNTQYVLTDLYPLSTILQLKTPFTTDSVSSFTTTIKRDDKYLNTTLNGITPDTVAVSGFSAFTDTLCSLSSNYFFTVNITSVETLPGYANEQQVFLTQDISGITWYLAADTATTTPAAWVSAGASNLVGLRFTLSGDKITIVNPQSKSKLKHNASNNKLDWALSTALTAAATLSATHLTINRNYLTDGFKYIPNSYSKYISSFNSDIVDLNTTTTVQHISNNYFVFSNNFKFKNDGTAVTLNADLFPLKNQATLKEYYAENNHFNSEPTYLNRKYEKIHSGTNQIRGYEKIGLSYNIGTYDNTFKANKLTYFTTPNSISPYTLLNIQDSKIDNLGAVPGDNPLMSDKVFKRREIIKSNNFSDDVNATYLCSWLSGDMDGNKRWTDRYYNPSIKGFTAALSAGGVLSGTAYYDTVCAASAEDPSSFTTEVFDVSSSLVFEKNNDYIYYHIGSNDYENLFDAYTQYNTASGIEYITSKGIPSLTSNAGIDTEVKLDGNDFGRFQTNIRGDFSINLWLHTKDFTLPFCHKILGNYFDEGIGVFNTDLVTPNIILPSGHKLLYINNDFEIYDEVEIKEGLDNVKILGIGRRDNYSDLYVLGVNKIIYVYNNNGNLISKIEDLKDSNVKIDDWDVGENKLHVLFNPVSAKNYFTYNLDTNMTSSVVTSVSAKTVGTKGKIFALPTGTTILSADSYNSYGNEVAWDSKNTPWIIKQVVPENPGIHYNVVQKGTYTTNVSTNTVKAGLDIDSFVQSVLIDDEDQTIVLHDENRISILNNDRKLLKIREFCDHITDSPISRKYIDLIYDFENGRYKKYILVIERFPSTTRLLKIDFNLNVISVKELRGITTNPLRLTKTVTSYSYLKKIGANKSRFKIVMKTKPRFTTNSTIQKYKHVVDFDITQLNPGYNHFFINVSLKHGYMCLFVNGKVYKKAYFSAGKFVLDNVLGTGIFVGAVSTPYYFTLANRLRQPGKYFVTNAKIKGFKLYDRTMSYFDMLAHYNYHIGDKDVIWSYPLGQRTYIDTIDKLMKFNLPEKSSNKYEVEINNTGITDTALSGKLVESLSAELKKLTPYFDEVKPHGIKIT